MTDPLVPLPSTKRSKGKKATLDFALQQYPGTKEERLNRLWTEQWYGCKRCPLHTFRVDSNGLPFDDIVFGRGNPDAHIMLVGEAPGAEEEREGVPFIGAAGRLLNQILAATSDDTGIQELYAWYNSKRHSNDDMNHFHAKVREWRDHEFFTTNTVACRPPENRTPTNPEAKSCMERLYNIINIVDPWLIITFGRTPIETLLHKSVEITKKRGELFEVEVPGIVTSYRKEVLACLHPAYLLRQADWKSKTGSYMRTLHDVMRALRYVDHMRQKYLGTPVPHRVELPKLR